MCLLHLFLGLRILSPISHSLSLSFGLCPSNMASRSFIFVLSSAIHSIGIECLALPPTRVCPSPSSACASPPRLALDPDCPLPTPPDVCELLRSSFKKTRGNVAGWRPLTQCFLCFTITTILPYHYLNLSHLLIDMCSFQPILMAFQASIVTPTPCHHHHAYVVTEPLSSWDVAMSWAMPLGDTSALPPEMKCVL